MKDAYSFDLSDDEAKKSYNKMFFAYLNTFKRLGLTAIPMAADTGPIGGDLSHEFIILAETGESKIYSDKRIFDIDISKHGDTDDSIKELRKKYDEFYAVTDDKFNKFDFEKKVEKKNQLVAKGIEVGHIFYFGDKYSKPLKCSVDLQDGKKVDVKMGSYGIGASIIAPTNLETPIP
jgi:prolyl-tRNA synthetase